MEIARAELARRQLDALAVEVALIDAASGRILDVNQTACDWLGYTRAELLSMTVSDLEVEAPVKSAGEWKEHVKQVRAAGQLVLEGRHRRKDGSTFPVVVTLTLLRAAGRECLMASAVDVTEERRLRQELADVESRAVAIISAMPDLCLLVSRDGRYLEAYAHSDDLLAFPRSAFMGRRLEEVVSAELARRTREATERVLATGALEVFEYDLPVSGRMRRWEARVTRRSENDVLILCRDITELRLAEIRLVQNARLASLGERAASIAHEIKNPLSVVLMGAERMEALLAKGPQPPEALLPLVAKVRKTASRIAEIVEALGTFSRKEERDPFVKAPAGAIVRDALALCREALRTHSVELEVSVPSDLTLECRPGQVAQILLNLLTNALDAVRTRAEKWCRVVVDADAESVRFSVLDSGPGIPAEIRDKIMEPFFTTKEIGRGTGLGLSISRRLAAEHGGTLALDPSSPNTCFTLRLPRRQSAASP